MKGQNALKQITLIKTGGTIPDIKQKYGDFEDWFLDGLGVPGIQTISVYKGQSLPIPVDTSAVVITGSAAMVSHREDWSEKTAAWLKLVVNAGVPVLGVCYGHQLLAHALGGKVGLNPRGRQMGTVSTSLLDSAKDDDLLGQLPSQFTSQTSHSEVVLELPEGAVRLATSPLDNNFAIRFSDKVWGVQFHPEFSGAVMSAYITFRQDAIRAEGLNPDQMLATTTDTDMARSVLKRFADLVQTA